VKRHRRSRRQRSAWNLIGVRMIARENYSRTTVPSRRQRGRAARVAAKT